MLDDFACGCCCPTYFKNMWYFPKQEILAQFVAENY